MNEFYLALVDPAKGKASRWTVLTIKDEEIVGIDSTCRCFREIIKKYGVVLAAPLPFGNDSGSRITGDS